MPMKESPHGFGWLGWGGGCWGVVVGGFLGFWLPTRKRRWKGDKRVGKGTYTDECLEKGTSLKAVPFLSGLAKRKKRRRKEGGSDGKKREGKKREKKGGWRALPDVGWLLKMNNEKGGGDKRENQL